MNRGVYSQDFGFGAQPISPTHTSLKLPEVVIKSRLSPRLSSKILGFLPKDLWMCAD